MTCQFHLAAVLCDWTGQATPTGLDQSRLVILPRLRQDQTGTCHVGQCRMGVGYLMLTGLFLPGIH